MRKRKKKNTKIILAAIIVAFIITTLGIFYTIKKFGGTQNLPSDNTQTEQNGFKGFFIGEKINQTGDLQVADQIGLYTHILTYSGGTETLGLKSKNVDLSVYSGSVQIQGTVTDIKNMIPIIDIEDIVSLNENILENTGTELTGETLTGRQTFFDFPGKGYYVDFFGNTGFNVDIQDDSVMISQAGESTGSSSTGNSDKEIGTIYSFACIPGDNIQDCANLEKRFKELNLENFVSTNGIKFYKRPESENWFFTNGNVWGYNLTVKTDNDAIKLSKYIYNYSPTLVKDKLSKNISTLCKNNETKMTKISTVKLTINDENKLIGTIEGTDNDGSKLTCQAEIKLGKTVEANPISFKIISKADKAVITGNTLTGNISTGSVQTNQPALSGSGTTSSTVSTGTVSVELSGGLSTGNMLEWNSREGFTVYFPKNVSFVKVQLSGDLQDFEKDLKCSYKINVINYKLKDQLTTNPAMELYYCNGNINGSGSFPGDVEIKQSIVNGKNLLIKYNDASGKDVGNKMIVY